MVHGNRDFAAEMVVVFSSAAESKLYIPRMPVCFIKFFTKKCRRFSNRFLFNCYSTPRRR